MKTDSKSLIAEFARIVPGLSLSVAWRHDPCFRWDGHGPDPVKRGFLPHDVTVTASIIQDGALIGSENHLMGCYDKPGKLCPEIHGYWNQMADEAISELPDFPGKSAALALLHAARTYEWEQQQKQKAA